jgi:hypothetical protein
MVRAQVRIGRIARIASGPLLLVAALAAVSAQPAAALVFHVGLSNGTVIDSLYEPQEASWDHGMVLVLTDAGNWIGVKKSDLTTVVSENATRGFGIAINATTISLGDAPNDLPVPNKDVGGSNAQALQNLLQGQQPRPNYTIQQGVQTEDTQGIPSSFISPYSGGPSALQPIVVQPPAPPHQQ